MALTVSAVFSASAFREDPFVGANRGIDAYHQAQSTFSEQELRIPRDLAGHSGTNGENADFNPFEVANVKKMLF